MEEQRARVPDGAPGDNSLLKTHHFLPESRANGPGTRAVVWLQGCSLGCPGCFNPETHPPDGGESIAPDDLFQRIGALQDKIEGITLSGGEPLEQRPALLALLRRVRVETQLSALLFTGYDWDEVRSLPEAEVLLECVDVLIAGRYNQRARLARGLRGSTNKTVHLLTDRYTLDDLQTTPTGEIVITAEGTVVVSGIDPPRLALAIPLMRRST